MESVQRENDCLREENRLIQVGEWVGATTQPTPHLSKGAVSEHMAQLDGALDSMNHTSKRMRESLVAARLSPETAVRAPPHSHIPACTYPPLTQNKRSRTENGVLRFPLAPDDHHHY